MQFPFPESSLNWVCIPFDVAYSIDVELEGGVGQLCRLTPRPHLRNQSATVSEMHLPNSPISLATCKPHCSHYRNTRLHFCVGLSDNQWIEGRHAWWGVLPMSCVFEMDVDQFQIIKCEPEEGSSLQIEWGCENPSWDGWTLRSPMRKAGGKTRTS